MQLRGELGVVGQGDLAGAGAGQRRRAGNRQVAAAHERSVHQIRNVAESQTHAAPILS
jgi:hypothetical protein